MVLAAADYWAAGRRPPPLSTPPGQADPLWRYLVRRQVASFGLPLRVFRYFGWMLPVVPPAARARWLVRRVVPRVRDILDSGSLCPLGVVRVRSVWPWRVVHQHQVLAWGHHATPGGVRLAVYDPNRPGADDVAVDIEDAGRQVTLGDGEREAVVTVFVTPWTPRRPPA